MRKSVSLEVRIRESEIKNVCLKVRLGRERERERVSACVEAE